MRLGLSALGLACGAAAAVVLAAAAPSPEALEAEARAVAQAFGGELKPTLKSALSSGGPTHAVSVCAEQAPAIAARLSAESGWQVARVSLKPRNPGASPDPWAAEQLERFDDSVRGGEMPEPVFEVADGEARLLVPQLTEGLCLTCHGLPTGELAATLAHHYPDDLATGYALGEVRGAISVRRRIE